MNQISKFISRLGAQVNLNGSLIVEKESRYFLLSEGLKKLIRRDFYYVGTYLGKTKRGRFFPSFSLLKIIAEKEASKIIVDKKTEWLFICGRDIFKQGIIGVTGSEGRGDYALILNQRGECLGFGRILRGLDRVKRGVVVKNISDIGDFLRRER